MENRFGHTLKVCVCDSGVEVLEDCYTGVFFSLLQFAFDGAIRDFFVSVDGDFVDFDLGIGVDVESELDAVGKSGISVLDDFDFCVEETFVQVVLFNISLGSIHDVITYYPTTDIYFIPEFPFLGFVDSGKFNSRESRSLGQVE